MEALTDKEKLDTLLFYLDTEIGSWKREVVAAKGFGKAKSKAALNSLCQVRELYNRYVFTTEAVYNQAVEDRQRILGK